MTDDLKSVLSKVKKLLRLAEGNANLHEAATAAAKAQELIDRYKLELGSLDEDEAIAIEEEPLFESGRGVPWKIRLAVHLAKANGCHVWRAMPSPALRGEGMKARLNVVGKPSNTQVLRYLFALLVREIERLAKSSWAAGRTLWQLQGVSAHKHALDFKSGAVEAIAERLRDERVKIRAEFADTPGLVLLDKEVVEAREFLNANIEGLVPIKQQDLLVTGAYDAGYAAGKTIAMNKGLEQGKVRGQLR